MTKDEALRVPTTKLIVPPNVDAQAVKNAYAKSIKTLEQDLLRELYTYNPVQR